MRGLCYHPVPWWNPNPSCGWGPCLGPWTATTVKDCDDVSIITLCYNWGNGRAGPNSHHSAHTHSHTLIHTVTHSQTHIHTHRETHSHTFIHTLHTHTDTLTHCLSHTHLSHFSFSKKKEAKQIYITFSESHSNSVCIILFTWLDLIINCCVCKKSNTNEEVTNIQRRWKSLSPVVYPWLWVKKLPLQYLWMFNSGFLGWRGNHFLLIKK